MKHSLPALMLASLLAMGCSGGPPAGSADVIEAVVQNAPGENGNKGGVAVLYAADHRFGCLFYADVKPVPVVAGATRWQADVKAEACKDLSGQYTTHVVSYVFEGFTPLVDGNSVVLRPKN
jgi:hypothetical protein